MVHTMVIVPVDTMVMVPVDTKVMVHTMVMAVPTMVKNKGSSIDQAESVEESEEC